MTTPEPRLDRSTGEALTRADLVTIRLSLETEIERLRRAEHAQQSRSQTPADAEVRSDVSERGSATVLAATTATILDDCEAALVRLEAAEYGTCERCGEPIDRFRLLAFPRVRLCLECKTGR